MSFQAEYAQFCEELDAWYRTYPVDVSALEAAMAAESARHPAWWPYQRKALIYETAARACAVQVFRHCPFYFELQSGRVRHTWGFGGIGGWMHGQSPAREIIAEGRDWWAPCSASGLSFGYPAYDDDHHCVGYDAVLQHGLRGLIAQAQARMAQGATAKERAFLESAVSGLRALIAIAERFAETAAAMLEGETDPAVRDRLARMAETARRVPAEPPHTFYEALNTLLFMRELCGSLEGIGVSVLGQMDRLLGPYYEADLAAGHLTRAEAKDLLGAFLAITDAKWGAERLMETSTCVVIGGCDAAGVPVWNAVTELILACYRELRLVNPKLNARISAAHPRAYFDALAELIASGANVVAVHNDDVLIPANVQAGKALEDCRLYVAGGCQENLLANTEINSRATIYLNLLHTLRLGLFPQEWAWFTAREGLTLRDLTVCDSFDDFHGSFLENLRAVMRVHAERRNLSERESWRINPCPILSATLSDCLDTARDMMEGGARYSPGSISLCGIGTLIDALYAVREVVFTQQRATLPELCTALSRDFAGDAALRGALLRVPKFGQDDAGIRAFSAQVFADVARAGSGFPNARGGVYEANVFVYRFFKEFGGKTPATPDGRRAGEWLSQGMGPSYLGLGEHNSVAGVLDALEPLDLTAYPVAAVLDLKLPVAFGGQRELIVPTLLRFLQAGGSVLQLNVVDAATLHDARTHPDRHPDLTVRVSGYSARFVHLPEDIQEEVMARTEMG